MSDDRLSADTMARLVLKIDEMEKLIKKLEKEIEFHKLNDRWDDGSLYG